MRVTILDYGAGNLHSLTKALAAPGVRVSTEADPLAALDTDLLVLPGVGAFGLAAARIASARDAMRDAITAGLPCLGICLGMQLLFDRSEEGEGGGLGVLSGGVRRLRGLRVPHMGWNGLDERTDPLLQRAQLTTAYFANSFVCEPDDRTIVTARTTHERDTFVSAVRDGNIVGVQFHPEKSGAPGVRFLRALLADADRSLSLAPFSAEGNTCW